MKENVKICIAFALGILVSLIVYGAHSVNVHMRQLPSPQEMSTRSVLQNFGGKVPPSASDVYYFTYGFQDRDEFLAVTLPTDDGLWQTAEGLSGKKKADFQPTTKTAAASLRSPRAAWKDCQSDGWVLDELSDTLFLLTADTGYCLVDAENRRVFYYHTSQ